MLTKFSFKNFKSIGSEPVMLDMVASQRIRMHPSHVRECSGARVLRNASIYGGNAAGKSNIIRAFDFMKASVVSGALPPNTAREFCRAGRGLAGAETVFEMQITTDGSSYDYGFSCVLSEYRIVSEWLYRLDGSPSLLFERDDAGNVRLGSDVEDGDGVSRDDLVRFQVYRDDFSAQASENPAVLFLSTMGKGKRFDPGSAFIAFGRVQGWFANKMHIMGANQGSPTSDFYADGKTLDEVAEVLSAFDTGVERLSKKVVPMEDLDKHVEFGVAMTIRQILAQAEQPSRDGKLALTVRSGNSFIGIEKDGTADPVLTILEIGHRNSVFDFEFSDESDGTKRLFDFMDILFSRSGDALFVVDEIDRSLHPMLTQQLVRLFNEVHKDDGCQLVFTTHENGIMSYDYFRKDEIWFVDRDDQGFSKLYSLDDFEGVRTDSRLSKQYLEGRYGGVPVLSAGRALAALSAGRG